MTYGRGRAAEEFQFLHCGDEIVLPQEFAGTEKLFGCHQTATEHCYIMVLCNDAVYQNCA
jgi:hypothetical protein